MISRIRGIILEKQAQSVLVDVSGVGYELLVPMNTVFALPEVGKEVIFHTHFVVREDVQQLYGFYDTKERKLFRLLIKVNGVGPKMALTLMSGMSSNEFVLSVQNDDVASLTRMPGVGKKTAERLIVEMRDKLADWLVDESQGTQSAVASGTSSNQNVKEAESALESLGYKSQQASKAVAVALKQLHKDDVNTSSEDLIRLALKNMV